MEGEDRTGCEWRAITARPQASCAGTAALVREYDRPLRELADRLLDDHQRMDDVLQEAYAKAGDLTADELVAVAQSLERAAP